MWYRYYSGLFESGCWRPVVLIEGLGGWLRMLRMDSRTDGLWTSGLGIKRDETLRRRATENRCNLEAEGELSVYCTIEHLEHLYEWVTSVTIFYQQSWWWLRHSLRRLSQEFDAMLLMATLVFPILLDSAPDWSTRDISIIDLGSCVCMDVIVVWWKFEYII